MNQFLLPQERGREEGAGDEIGKRELPKVNDTQGFLTLGQSNWTICSLFNSFCSKKFPPFFPAPHNEPIFITPERGRSKGWNWEKWTLQKWTRHVSDPWAIQPDHLQPFKLILFQNIYTSPIMNQFLLHQERGREEGAGAEIGKRELSTIEWDTGFLTLGQSNWTICSLLNSFCSKIFPPFYPAPHNEPILINPERGRSRGWN